LEKWKYGKSQEETETRRKICRCCIQEIKVTRGHRIGPNLGG
jgi:hypothetical protein